MYGGHDPSTGPKLLLTVLHVLGAAAAVAYLLFWPETTAELWRKLALAAASIVYLARFLASLFVMLRRTFGWSEAAVVGLWASAIHAVFAFLGGSQPGDPTLWTWIGVALYVGGSALHTTAEVQRMRFKDRPGNRDSLYTGGLFAVVRHPNYLGDTVLFTGFALLTGSPWALAVPALMALLFTTVNIPELDRHLRCRYTDFDAYAARTPRYIPLFY